MQSDPSQERKALRMLLEWAEYGEGQAPSNIRRTEALKQARAALAAREQQPAQTHEYAMPESIVAERVAQAIFETRRSPKRVRHGDKPTRAHRLTWEDCPAEPKAGYRMQARAAIAELAAREDTERDCPHCGKLMLVPGCNYEIDPAAVCRCHAQQEPKS
jgi:hypothetical protein